MKEKTCARCGHSESHHKLWGFEEIELDYYKCISCNCEIHGNVLQNVFEVYDDCFNNGSDGVEK